MSDGKTSVTMLDEFNRTTLDVIGSVAFGMDLNSINDPNNKLNSLITKSITLAFNYFISTKLTVSNLKLIFIYTIKNELIYFILKVFNSVFQLLQKKRND